MADKLHLYLFGSPQFTFQDKPVTGFVSNKARALLIYLAVTQRAHSREALAELLWADTPPRLRRASLRKVLSNLRQVVHGRLLEPFTDTVAVDPQHCWSDVWAFEQVVNHPNADITQLEDAAERYQADFLADFNTSLSYEFEAWALGEQTRLKLQLSTLLDRLTAAYAETGELHQAITTARRLLAVEPWREATHRRLMGLLVHTGDRSAALAQFHACVAALKTELAVDPAAETCALFDQINAGTYPAEKTTTAPPAQQRATVTPSPFFNVPFPPTPLVGRQQVLSDVAQLLQRDGVRLVTLTGPGGVGKTRLALQIGHDLVAQFAHGARFVELAPLRAAHLIPVAIAEALGIREAAGNRPLLAHIGSYLRDKQILLIVDNFEHLIDGAPTISTILAGAPQVKMLVTSREVLHMRGEFAFVVPPLQLPHQQYHDQRGLDTVESVQLFLQQVQSVRPNFITDAAAIQQVADICIRLDGLPLAIELAAARAKLLTIDAIAARLEARFDFLQRGPRDAPPRHQTLQNAIDWSYDLLSTDEQTLFCRLTVFVGGCTPEAVTALWSFDHGASDVLDLLTSLVDKSLLVRQPQQDNTLRFIQLESILAYGQRKLRTASELSAVRSAHAQYFLDLAEEAEPMLYGAEQVIWLARLGVEHDNLRTALDWLIQRGKSGLAARLGIALWHFWYMQSHHLEGTVWLEQILTLHLSISERAKILYGLGMLARRTGNDEDVNHRLTEALSLFRQDNDLYHIASTLRVLGFNEFRDDKIEAAQQKLEEALALFRRLESKEGSAVTLINLGYIQMQQRNFAVARRFLEECLAIRRQTGNQHGVANCLDALGYLAMYQKEYDVAKTLLTESRQIYETLGNHEAMYSPMNSLGMVAYLEGQYTTAELLFENTSLFAMRSGNHGQIFLTGTQLALTKLRLYQHDCAVTVITNTLKFVGEISEQWRITFCLAVFSLIALANKNTTCGLRVAAKVKQIYKPTDRPILAAAVLDELDMAVADLRDQIEHSEFSTVWANGEEMTLKEVLETAFQKLN